MASEEINLVRSLLASFPDMREKSIEELRAMTDEWVSFFPLSEGISVESVDAGGVPGEWVKADGAIDDAVIVYLHGGGYALGSPATSRYMAAAYSQAASASILAIDYRLAPEHRFPAAVEDALRGYRWLVGQGTPPGRIAVAGDSAGGGLTVATLLALRDRGAPLPSAGICVSPWLDLTCSADSYRTKAGTDPMLNHRDASWMASLYLGDKDPKTPLASPLFADLRGLPPMLIQVGSEEVLLDDSVTFDRRAREAGVDSTLEVWEGMIHVWHVFFQMLKEGREAISRIGEYFKARIS